ncbi:hypothetical protein [Natrinema hispanicum]|uniref:hypothetical protein n=1 Tax=Natrinema hispanicum TaxID=392421 RepID=UPI00102BC049|nr:hypothetical protein [Natrinema hispanicum]
MSNFDAIVIVTLFYATALFFTNFLQAERPYPDVVFENDYYNGDYGEGNNGFQYEVELRNNGTAPMIDPTVEYRLYDSTFTTRDNNSTDGWITHPDTDRNPPTIEPGEQQSFVIEHSPVTHNGETDYYLCVKMTPRIQYREVTLLYVREIAAEE